MLFSIARNTNKTRQTISLKFNSFFWNKLVNFGLPYFHPNFEIKQFQFELFQLRKFWSTDISYNFLKIHDFQNLFYKSLKVHYLYFGHKGWGEGGKLTNDEPLQFGLQASGRIKSKDISQQPRKLRSRKCPNFWSQLKYSLRKTKTVI